MDTTPDIASQEPSLPTRGHDRGHSRALRDGCEPCTMCPLGVVACAHYDGKMVWLGDARLCKPHASEPYLGPRWRVSGPNTTMTCPCYSGHTVMDGPEFITDSLPAAEAEFEAQAAQLLGRSSDG